MIRTSLRDLLKLRKVDQELTFYRGVRLAQNELERIFMEGLFSYSFMSDGKEGLEDLLKNKERAKISDLNIENISLAEAVSRSLHGQSYLPCFSQDSHRAAYFAEHPGIDDSYFSLIADKIPYVLEAVVPKNRVMNSRKGYYFNSTPLAEVGKKFLFVVVPNENAAIYTFPHVPSELIRGAYDVTKWNNVSNLPLIRNPNFNPRKFLEEM